MKPAPSRNPYQNLAGRLDRRVLVERSDSAPNGEPNPIWTPAYEGWGTKEDEMAATEDMENRRIVATGRTTWTVRYTPNLLPTMRLTDRETGIRYYVENVTEGGRRQATILNCKRYDS